MYPLASQFVFDAANSRLCVRISDNDTNKNAKRSQFEIESILRNNFCDKTVTAGSVIEKNLKSNQFAFDQMLIEENLPKKFIVSVQNDKIISPTESIMKQKFWLKSIRIADDIPGANTLLEIRDDNVEMRSIKTMNVGDELLLWFSEEILNLMGIPFLAPSNIQGQKAYVCLHCYRSYEVPNQLKIHLARNCDQFEESLLWKRLQAELLSRHQRKVLIQSRNFEMLNQFHPTTSNRRFSAFQPVINKCENSSSPPTTAMPMPSLSPVSHDSALAAAAHLETIVSNMGTSKQGHLCIYCGKLYSRKYGLKIHIRTHTGFKPLKCRHCFRAFGDPSNLNKHIRLHNQSSDHHTASSSSSVYKCHICSKILLKRRELQRHMQLKHSSNSSLSNSSVDESSMTLLSVSPSSSSSSSSEDETR
ncbi:CLUMA_CG009415, isoform A [Clunio marinus]|uniref:CLUMA_CG009415, isoform A n=1 Tax=Clunio marinus TaxID=568069 RepID=A0A1J1IAI9_9DIPT|nr:CLUMA_CG009415, isoform A [Clunio marinus]